MRRGLKWVPALLVAVLATAASLLLLKPPTPIPSPISAQNYDRISVGMSRAEVEAILGPPRRVEGGKRLRPTIDRLWEEVDDQRTKAIWSSAPLDIHVSYFRERVSDKHKNEKPVKKPGLVDYVERELKRWLP